MASDNGSGSTLISNGERAVVALLSSVFETTSDVALTSFMKLKTFLVQDNETKRLFASASDQTLTEDFDTIVERTSNRALKWDTKAIIRQVLMPMAGGYLGYALAGALGFVGAVPALIGLLVGAVIWLMNAPGTLDMLKTKITQTLDEIFSPF